MELNFPDGIEIVIPNGNFLTFASEVFSTYDGIQYGNSNEINVVDIAITVMMNSRISGNTASEILRHSNAINNLLRQIPDDFDLSQNDLNDEIRNNLQQLINTFCEINRVRLAIATKILHRKKPKLIPMFDNVVENFYRQRYRRRIPSNNCGRKFIALLQYFQNDLRYQQIIQEIIEMENRLQEQETLLTRVRILEGAIWVATEPTGRYRNQ
jgi:flagellar biosynthesis regulator FlaF